MTEPKRNDPKRIEPPEATREVASPAVRHEVRVTSYLLTQFSYGAKGELLSVVRMTPREGIVDRHEYFHYRDPDAA